MDGRQEGRTDRSIDGIEREGGREGPSEYEVWKRERERRLEGGSEGGETENV